MTNFNELQEETREIITDLLNDGSDPDALYIIEHHIAHYDFDTLEKIAVDAFKAGYEVSEAEEFEDESGKVIFCFDMRVGLWECVARNNPLASRCCGLLTVMNWQIKTQKDMRLS